ncbi:hypothetical protein DOTSEDRAFT_69469 [Dothistroma septosporum NZE10]|uniref:2,6-dihydroxypyridine 3-monooxygenase substrate binding domain-containing protein n=1 Tax=Dothistroma septosporum (strain NZE10 / CBS 128990) TaxID=675120 RepID=N1PZ70_DOTSN|nr:hypothetical protein DOTSEDRAFT_69469 [Dothistroma septosporum NZE10]
MVRKIRHAGSLNPGLECEEPGYIIWRSTVPTKDVSKKLLDKVENKPMIRPGQQSFCVIYTIPGDDGSLNPEERYINFAWYFWSTEFSLRDIMTDSDGHYHRSTSFIGKLRPEIWKPPLAQAHCLLHPELIELVEHIKEPFGSVVSSVSASKAASLKNGSSSLAKL